jgi:AcrR family transcriptional regulator
VSPHSGHGGTRTSIIEAAARSITRDGVAGATNAVIAAESGVSKALLHYHFSDRAQLLAETARLLGARLVSRERRALERAEAATAVDLLWRWIEGELKRGELHALLELRAVREPAVQSAIKETNEGRRATGSATVAGLFEHLGLTPRVPTTLIASATVAFMDGLAMHEPDERDARVSFDVYWLAILSLGD